MKRRTASYHLSIFLVNCGKKQIPTRPQSSTGNVASLSCPCDLLTAGGFILGNVQMLKIQPFQHQVKEVCHRSLGFCWFHNLQCGHLETKKITQRCFQIKSLSKVNTDWSTLVQMGKTMCFNARAEQPDWKIMIWKLAYQCSKVFCFSLLSSLSTDHLSNSCQHGTDLSKHISKVLAVNYKIIRNDFKVY